MAISASEVGAQNSISIPSQEITRYVLILAFLGSLTVVWLTNIIAWLYSKRGEHLWYSLYGLSLTLYYGAKAAYPIASSALVLDILYSIDRLVQPLFLLAYCQFVIVFIDSRKRYPKINTMLTYYGLGLLLSFVLMAIGLAANIHPLHLAVWHIYRMVASVMGFVILISLWRINRDNHKAVSFVLYGSLALLVGGTLAMILSLTSTMVGPISPLDWMTIGILIELGIFSAGMGYKALEAKRAKIKAQNRLIAEMEKSKQVTVQANEELNEKVEAATARIQKEERRKLVAEMNIKQLDTELQLLRAQMNPHFIFNSLNSIKSFIIKSEPRIAGDYLAKFAYLMRRILSSSKEQFVALREELQTVKTYIELEQLRFAASFDFEIAVDPAIDQDQVQVLPLLLQPYAENAIWHGLLHSDQEGLIKIHVRLSDPSIVITITDNGIGREQARRIKEGRDNKRKSYGTSITKQRLAYTYGQAANIAYRDPLKGGTEVQISIPPRKVERHEK